MSDMGVIPGCAVCGDPAVAEVEAVRRWRWADGDMGWPDVERHGDFVCAACLHHERRRWARGPWRIRVVRYVTTTVTLATRDP